MDSNSPHAAKRQEFERKMTLSENQQNDALWKRRECEHKWRAYEQIGVVCRDCGKAAPPEIARLVACHTEDAK